MDYNLNFSAVWRSFGLLLEGLGLSLILAAAAISIGAIIGLLVAFVMRSHSPLLRRVSGAYVTLIRNTPILVLILFVYFALPDLGIQLSEIQSFLVTLSVYSGAYLAEVFRAGLLSVPKGLQEAGLAVGLTWMQIRISIVVPVMLRNVLPAFGSTVISLFKDTSLAAVIAVPELTYYARKINVESFRVIETWVVVSILYVFTCVVLASIFRRVERALAIPR